MGFVGFRYKKWQIKLEKEFLDFDRFKLKLL
jgi:hypothetical protein